jgi:hypothetical protein
MRAREKVDEILETQKGPGISPEVNKALEEYYKIISVRTYDDFQKAEGMEKATGTKLPGME